jgi:hypothetical protein
VDALGLPELVEQANHDGVGRSDELYVSTRASRVADDAYPPPAFPHPAEMAFAVPTV